MALWSTLYVESWKRKQNFLANRWLVRDYREISFARQEFKATLNVDQDLATTQLVKPTNYIKWLVSIPVSLIFMALIIVIYVFIQLWQKDLTN